MREDTVRKAAEEYDILSTLSVKLSERIREGYRSSRPAVIRSQQQVDLINISDGLTKAFEEVAKRGYGRVIFGEEYDAEGQAIGAAIYRVSQANAGFPDRPIRLVARNSLIGSRIASCSVGDEISFRVPIGERSILVTGIIDISGMSNLLQENPDAKRAMFRLEQSSAIDQILNLRAFVRSLAPPPVVENEESVQNDKEEGSSELLEVTSATELTGASEAEAEDLDSSREVEPVYEVFESKLDGGVVVPLEPVLAGTVQASPINAIWDIHPDRMLFGDDEEVSLGTQFFTQTTSKQEEGIRTVRGLQIVHGVAGSGKTSVALGRLKFFANFRSLQNLQEFGLEEANFADFDASSMIGFVLSPSLVSYLKQTAESLDIGSMKIQDFTEFLNSERMSRRVFQGRPFKKSLALGHPDQKTVAWLKILDLTAARYLADGIRQVLESPLLRPSTEGSERISDRRWNELVESYWRAGQLPARVRALLRDLEGSLDLNPRIFLLRKVALEIDRRVRLGDNETSDLDTSERRVLREAIENAQLRMLRLLNPQDVYVEIFKQKRYLTILEELALQAGMSRSKVIEPIIARLEENLVTDDDTICALCLNALCCDQFEREVKATPYLRSFAERVGVFIDEYQDFSEVQVLLMGYKAKPKYWLVTVSGDASQRLHHDGLAEVQRAFPQIATRHTAVVLDNNMRQSGALASLSACFRSLTEDRPAPNCGSCRAPVEVFDDPQEFANLAVSKIAALPQTASVAVICADDDEVDRWFSLMQEELETGFKNPMVSDQSKLTTRYHTHFTTPLQAKGLEFDVVVIPDLSSFDGDDAVGRNSLYVAASRPRHALLMGCDYSKIDTSLIIDLVDREHLVLRSTGDIAVENSQGEHLELSWVLAS